MNGYAVFDAHCDTLCHIADKKLKITDNGCSADKNRMTEYKSYTQVFACFIAPRYYEAPRKRFDKLYKAYRKLDFSGIKPILSLEGGEMIKSIEDVEYLHECGVRAVALTWNNTNRLAGGADDPDSGLTDFGRAVIRKMEKLNILLDVSHLNDKSFYDAVSVSTRPVIASHSDSRALCPHRRNITDDMFKIIKDSGGCVGLNYYPLFLTERGDCGIEDVVRHAEHFLSLDGEDAVGLGSDFDGIDRTPNGLGTCSDVCGLLDSLQKSGITKEITGKISHANFERVFGEE